MKRSPPARRGIAAVWLMIVLTVLAGLFTVITAQHLSGRRGLDRRQKQLQAEWLARAGIERGVARLLTSADEASETVALIPGSQVRISVGRAPPVPVGAISAVALAPRPLLALAALAAAPARPARPTYVVTSEARYRVDEPPPVVWSQSRRFRRTESDGVVRVTPLIRPR
jgi:hypothetical protein